MTLAGSGSVRTTPVAVEGPRFVTTMMKLKESGYPGAGASTVFDDERSAATDVEALEASFAGFGSGVADDTDAAFTIGLGAV